MTHLLFVPHGHRHVQTPSRRWRNGGPWGLFLKPSPQKLLHGGSSARMRTFYAVSPLSSPGAPPISPEKGPLVPPVLDTPAPTVSSHDGAIRWRGARKRPG